MRLEGIGIQSVQVALHPLELAGLLTAARWVLTGIRDTPPPEALDQLRRILADYDRQAAVLAGRRHAQATDEMSASEHAETAEGHSGRYEPETAHSTDTRHNEA